MKKYLCIVFILFSFFTSALNVINVKAFLPLSGKLIIIDPGHGGKDPGTSYGDIYEKNINLEIALKLEGELAKRGASVILTRDGDYDLSKANAKWRKKSDFDNRIRIINNNQADLYLSIHLNYLSDAEYYGAQVFYDKKNKRLASIIQEKINENLENDRKIKQIPVNTYLYRQLNIPGVLIECGFLSNYKERNLLIDKNYQKKLASLIAEAISSYF